MRFSKVLSDYLECREKYQYESSKSTPSQRELANIEEEIIAYEDALDEFFPKDT